MTEVLSELIIVGGGPAGLTAAIYAKRAGLDVTLLEKMPMPGGQMATTPEIENYPGTGRIDGFTLAQKMAEQAAGLGVSPVIGEVTRLTLLPGDFAAETGTVRYRARSMILAMGARRKRLGIPGEAELEGRGLSFCAVCDGHFYKGKAVAVIGGGNTALEDALHLAGLGCAVTLIHRRDAFRGSHHLVDKVRHHSGISLLMPATPLRFEGGSGAPLRIVLKRNDGEDESVWEGMGIFECVGTRANTESVADSLRLDENGRIPAGEDCRTEIEGLFAAGDIRRKPLYQIVTAAADGAASAEGAAQFCRTKK